jgi:hypothetical protein
MSGKEYASHSLTPSLSTQHTTTRFHTHTQNSKEIGDSVEEINLEKALIMDEISRQGVSSDFHEHRIKLNKFSRSKILLVKGVRTYACVSV